ncbi:F0F1 ATP synthase subunit B [Thermosynechococcus sp. M55_K2018_012]|uniref:F0F1 ATP synthase subunit B n=1 Tax=Thermosynechococcus sp. M55_K2018_012 TaxID=2747809 RepID=UPI0019EB1F67|nr:F0F1 ATP synthase subunit B [Thermosynechococcus sp. M55_K2018_012]HIK48850.1 F0F1 ATP synthase subunit B [Thermosynechococcus sp. M55_K2018_012]
MDAVFLLATEEVGQFGINTNLLETNVINLAIIIGVLVYFGRGVLGKALGDRQQKIAAALAEAEERQKVAAARLVEEQQKLAQAKQEAQRIREDALARAKAAKEELIAQAKREIERLKEAASQDTTAATERAIAEIRERIAAMALAEAEKQLKARLSQNPDLQRTLVDRSIALLGGK